MRTKEEAVMMRIQSIALCSLALASLSLSGAVIAEDSPIYYQIEGTASCNSFGPNYVDGLAEKSPDFSPDGSIVTDGLLAVEYTVTPDANGRPILDWESVSDPVVPVNYVIVTGGETKGSQKSLVYHFGTPGAPSGSHLAPSNVLTSFQFCYGLDGEVIPEPVVLTAVCYDPEEQRFIDGSAITCPAETSDESDERIIWSTAPVEGNPLANIQVCTCNYNTAFQSCDPTLLAGTPGSCMPPAVPTPFTDESGEVLGTIPPGKGLQYPPAAITIFQNGTGGCYVSATGDYECITNYDYCTYLPAELRAFDPNCL